MDINYYKSLEPFWGNWRIDREIGEGAYGKVFEVSREEFGQKYTSAMKAITIPQTEGEWNSALMDGMDEISVTSMFRGYVKELVQEIALMSRFKGQSNIVSYEDHAVIEHANGHGWDILIRMELLIPLYNVLPKDSSFSRDQVVKLGLDMCNAISLCEKNHLIHRDIKPENIFLSPLGDYKLGDFGIARKVEQTTGALSKKGTYTYMAPEVYKEKPYGATVDTYSLGIVLYRLLNRNRAPFLPPYPQEIKHTDRESALRRRMMGESIPLPVDAQDALGLAICKACAYDPKQRYQSAAEFSEALWGATAKGTEPVIPVQSEPSAVEAPVMTPLSPEPTSSIYGQVPVPAPSTFSAGTGIVNDEPVNTSVEDNMLSPEPTSSIYDSSQVPLISSQAVPVQIDVSAVDRQNTVPPAPYKDPYLQDTTEGQAGANYAQNMVQSQPSIVLTTQKNSPQKKKWIIPVGIAAALVALVVVISIVISGQKNRYEPQMDTRAAREALRAYRNADEEEGETEQEAMAEEEIEIAGASEEELEGKPYVTFRISSGIYSTYRTDSSILLTANSGDRYIIDDKIYDSNGTGWYRLILNSSGEYGYVKADIVMVTNPELVPTLAAETKDTDFHFEDFTYDMVTKTVYAVNEKTDRVFTLFEFTAPNGEDFVGIALGTRISQRIVLGCDWGTYEKSIVNGPNGEEYMEWRITVLSAASYDSITVDVKEVEDGYSMSVNGIWDEDEWLTILAPQTQAEEDEFWQNYASNSVKMLQEHW